MIHFHRTASCKIPEQKCHNDILLHFDSRAENIAVLHLSEDLNQRSNRKGPTTTATFIFYFFLFFCLVSAGDKTP